MSARHRGHQRTHVAYSRRRTVMADFGMSVRVDAPLDQALERTRAALADQGFGILTEIDVAATLKAKLDVDVPPQIILGACNAPLARPPGPADRTGPRAAAALQRRRPHR
jgi:uncharacterized protein (DUF302 family)